MSSQSTSPPASITPEATQPVRQRRNWSLWIGGILVGFILLLAVFGPELAPRDPREHNLIIQIDGEWLIPAYPAFTPGFPLGSDNLGRDLYSWLLWSVRPTIILVGIVAMLRMVLGVLIGVTAGWSERLPGRLAEIAISGALAVPALIASLIVITAVGFRLGIWAFVVGLSVTGWAETAQMVREQTRTVKGEDSVEAARALGESGAQILLLHILPHIMPMIWMLLAFEVSHTLVTTAGLGFLGYYLGGAVFAEVDDFVYQRISEMPELGQMLATAWLVLDEPWAMVAAGTIVFLIVLAFNLVGEGLQHRLTRKLGGARVLYLRAAGDVIPWLDDHISAPLGALLHSRVAQGALLIVIVAAIVVSALQGFLGPGAQGTLAPIEDESPPTVDVILTASAQEPEETASAPAAPAFEVPGGHIWANEDHDPWRARWAPFTGPLTTTVQWSWKSGGRLTGGPVIDREDVLYIAGRVEDEAGALYALSAAGELVWEVDLVDEPVGSPALDAEGTIYVADRAGLTAVTPAGGIRWRADAPGGTPAVSSPVAFPDGATVYKSLSGLVALDSSGDLLWHTPMTDTRSTSVPHLGADGQTVFWNELGFQLETGAPVTQTVPTISGNPDLTRAVVGADREWYWQRGVALVRDVTTAPEEEIVPFFDLRSVTWQGADAGISPAGRPWLAARPSVGGMGLGFFWGDAQGELSAKLDIPGARNARVLAVDAQGTAYICADAYQNGTPMCVAMGTDAARPLWRLPLRGLGAISGAALAPGRLYVATWDGNLLAVGDD